MSCSQIDRKAPQRLPVLGRSLLRGNNRDPDDFREAHKITLEVFGKMQETTLSGYIDGLFGYAMVLTRNPAEAADLVQETYLRALKAKESLGPGSNVKSWLFTILRNIWLNQLRHERTAPQLVELEAHEGIADVAIATSKDPHAQYVSKIEQETVRNAIQQLPAGFREIIVLREYEELSYWTIAG